MKYNKKCPKCGKETRIRRIHSLRPEERCRWKNVAAGRHFHFYCLNCGKQALYMVGDMERSDYTE